MPKKSTPRKRPRAHSKLECTTPPLCVQLSSPSRSWEEIWKPFVKTHRPWWERFQSEPVYLLPEEVIKHLTRSVPADDSHRARRALIDSSAAETENQFREMCQKFNSGTIG